MMHNSDAETCAGYEYDFAAHRLTVSDALRRGFGVSEAEARNPVRIFDRIAFEDYPAIAQACGEIYCSRACELSLCFKVSDGAHRPARCIQVMARVQYDQQGRPVRLWGHVEDAAVPSGA